MILVALVTFITFKPIDTKKTIECFFFENIYLSLKNSFEKENKAFVVR